MTDFDTWLLDVGYDRVFRMWKYKRMFTPYEQEQKFADESVYEDSQCDFVMIKEAIELPDGDILLGYQNVEFDRPLIEYVKLSEISLAYYEDDKKFKEDGGIE